MTTVVTLAEASSNALMGSSVAGTVRPRRYYKIPKETLEASLDDLENLINFFVIEGQRIVFAENIPVTAAVSFALSMLSHEVTDVFPGFPLRIRDILPDQAPSILGSLAPIHHRDLSRPSDLS